jgi:hypothetical protein
MKLFGLLVVYSPEPRRFVEKQFRSFIESFDVQSEVLVINNGVSVSPEDLRGTNENGEFSGWAEGIRAVPVREDDVLVFANDTFCTRHAWGWLMRTRHRVGVRSVLGGDYDVCGEVSEVPMTFNVKKYRSAFWIRTHLFAIKASTLQKVGQLSLDQQTLLSLVTLDSATGRLVWGKQVSQNLRERIENWLYPPSDGFGWYKARDSTPFQKLKKAHAILNEKWLSAALASHGARVFDCSPSIFTKAFRRGRSRFRQIVLRK